MRQKVNFQWKTLLAVFSLLLTVLIWQRGLQESFDRPSVNPKLSLNQHEIALLASPALPKPLGKFLVGADPDSALRDILKEIPPQRIEDRERLLLALLDESGNKVDSLLGTAFTETNFKLIKETLLESFKNENVFYQENKALELLNADPLLYRVSCLAIGGDKEICIDQAISRKMAFKLVGSQLLPLLATIIGIGLCLRQGWLLLRKKNLPWSKISSIPLSLIDMVILVAGGFVVLGEVIIPLLVLPIGQAITSNLHSPVKESLNVFIGYSAMTVPPLLIFRQQLKEVREIQAPLGGWMQWGSQSVGKAFLEAVRGWLMIMPFVLVTSWLAGLLIGDPGGSNPLLEMVLGSHNYVALSILFVTTVVLAPLFEEFVFRGVLLPVLAKEQGLFMGVIVSAFVFALAHLSIGELPPLLVLGIGLAILRLSSGRLLPCVIMHALWNGVTFANLLLLGS